MARRSDGEGRAYALAALACLAPVVVLLAVFLTRAGVIGLDVGYDLIAQRIGRWLALAGLACGLLLAVVALRRRRHRALAAIALTVSLATVAVYLWTGSRPVVVEDVSTDLTQPPGFNLLAASRGPSAPARSVACDGADAIPTQALPEVVVYHLQAEGFEVRRTGVTGVYGTRIGTWFGVPFDVAVRIRPGRTDIRVAARDRRAHGGEACRLAAGLSERLRVAHRL